MNKILLSCILSISIWAIPHISAEMNHSKNPECVNTVFFSDEETSNIRSELVSEIRMYILKYASDSKIHVDSLLNLCVKYEFDIVLAISQAHIESHFGTKGRAGRTNSVFNVGAFDSGFTPKKYIYTNPNQSIEPYLSLMNRNYIKDDIPIDSLLQPNKFVNMNGKRYASFPKYEYRIKYTYDKIKMETNIDSLYNLYTSEVYVNSLILNNMKNKVTELWK